MTDQIHIRDLHLRTIIGINAEERRDRQDVLVNLVLYADTRLAGASDDIAQAVNYRTLTKRIIELVETSQFYLVEKLAAEIAAICLEDPHVERVSVTVEKPGALRFARSVGVTVEREQPQNLVYLSLGSNIEPERNLAAAVTWLGRWGRIRAVSTVWESAPVGFADQPNFLNAAVLLETSLSAQALRQEAIASIETALGRVRTENKNAPRTIDIDIMLFNRDVLQVSQRRIPSPEVLERPFVAIPLAEIAPDYVHPETGQTLRQIARRFDPTAAGMHQRDDIALFVGPE